MGPKTSVLGYLLTNLQYQDLWLALEGKAFGFSDD